MSSKQSVTVDYRVTSAFDGLTPAPEVELGATSTDADSQIYEPAPVERLGVIDPDLGMGGSIGPRCLTQILISWGGQVAPPGSSLDVGVVFGDQVSAVRQIADLSGMTSYLNITRPVVIPQGGVLIVNLPGLQVGSDDAGVRITAEAPRDACELLALAAIPGGGNGGGSQGCCRNFLWSPGGPTGPGVLTTWAEVVAALGGTPPGRKNVMVDGVGVIPPGVWALGDVSFSSARNESPGALVIEDGASSSGLLYGFSDALQVLWRGSAPFCVTTSPDEPFMIVERGARVATDGNSAPFVLADGSSLTFVLTLAGGLLQGGGGEPGSPGSPLLEAVNGGDVQAGLFGAGADLSDDVLAGDLTSAVSILVLTTGPFQLGTSQPAVLSGLGLFLLNRASLLAHVAAVPTDWQAPLNNPGQPFPVSQFLDQIGARLQAGGL